MACCPQAGVCDRRDHVASTSLPGGAWIPQRALDKPCHPGLSGPPLHTEGLGPTARCRVPSPGTSVSCCAECSGLVAPHPQPERPQGSSEPARTRRQGVRQAGHTALPHCRPSFSTLPDPNGRGISISFQEPPKLRYSCRVTGGAGGHSSHSSAPALGCYSLIILTVLCPALSSQF